MKYSLWKYFWLWFPMIGIAIANGLLREVWYGRRLGELRAHQLSTLSALVLLGLYMWLVLRLLPPASAGQAARVGLMWLALTVAFEFLFGHFVAGHSWSRLFQDYNLMAGRVWVLVLVWLAVAPVVFYGLRS